MNLNLKKIYKFIQETNNSSKQNLKIGLLGQKQYFPNIKEALSPDPLNSVIELSDNAFSNNCDLLIISVDDTKDLISSSFQNKTPTIFVLPNRVELQNDDFLTQIEKKVDLKNMILLEEKDFENKLQATIAHELKEKRLTLGRTLPVFRKQISAEIISSTALQNTLVAGVTFLPGADMPVLTLNQIKMVVELGALYNNELSIDRLKEIIATFGGGYLYRSIARQLLDFLPGPGFIIKAAVSYSGTQASGQLFQKYFEKENPNC